MVRTRHPQCGTFAPERPLSPPVILVLVIVIVVLPSLARSVGYGSIAELAQVLGALVLLAETLRRRHDANQ